jgi:hypothetical protein
MLTNAERERFLIELDGLFDLMDGYQYFNHQWERHAHNDLLNRIIDLDWLYLRRIWKQSARRLTFSDLDSLMESFGGNVGMEEWLVELKHSFDREKDRVTAGLSDWSNFEYISGWDCEFVLGAP